MTITTLPIDAVRHMQPGESILYRNSYGQMFTAKIERKHLSDDGRLFFFVKRTDWKWDECLAFSDFQNGTYSVISDVKGGVA